MKTDVKKLTAAAVFSALAFGISALCNVVPITLVPSLGFLHFDGKDVIVAICGFIFGPLYAVAVSLVAAVLELIISSTGLIGMVMNFLSSAIFAGSAALIYKAVNNIKGAVLGLLCATLATSAFMLAWNFLITPLYMGISREAVTAMLLPAFLPFNLIKGGINTGITLLVYKPVVTALRSAGIVDKGEGSKPDLRSAVIAVVTGLVCLGLCVMAALYFNDVI